MAEIDSLEISIKAEASKAESALASLQSRLNGINKELLAIDGQGLNSLSTGMRSLADSMLAFKTNNINGQTINGLATNINKFNSVDISGLRNVANGIAEVAKTFQSLQGVSQQASDVSVLASSIAKLGYKSVGNAIANMPRLTSELQKMLTALSRVPSINKSVIQMTSSIASLASQGSKVGYASQSMSHGIRNVGYASERSSRKVFSLAAAFGKFYATYFLVIRGLKGLWKSIETSMDYVETFNYMKVTLNKMGSDFATSMGEAGEESAKQYAESFTNTLNDLNRKMTGYTVSEYGELMASGMGNLGLDSAQLMQFQAKIGAVTNSVGMLGNQSVMTQKALSMLSADLSSLTNTDLDTVMGNLSSGLIGQSRALYKYGIDITNASLKQTAFEHGITKSLSAMSQQEKMQLRVLTILKQSQVAWGDQANTINSVANQYRVFKQQALNLARILGNLFLPIVQSVLPKINGLIIALQKLFTTLGFQIHGDTWLKDINDGISGGYIEEDAELVEELDEALDGAAVSAKKLKQQLQGFDELNVLSSKDDSGSAIGGSLIDLSADIEEALSEYESVWNKAFEGMQNKAIEFAEMLSKKLEPIKKLFADIINGDWYSVGQDVSNLAKAFFDTISKALEKVDWKQVGRNVGDFLAGQDWVGILKSVGKAIFEALKAVIEVWLESFKKSPLKTLTITFAALKFTHLGQILTGAVLSKSIATSLGLTSVGGLFAYSIAATLAIDWAFDFGKKNIGKNLSDMAENGLISENELKDAEDALYDASFGKMFSTDNIKKNFEEATKGWKNLFNFDYGDNSGGRGSNTIMNVLNRQAQEVTNFLDGINADITEKGEIMVSNSMETFDKYINGIKNKYPEFENEMKKTSLTTKTTIDGINSSWVDGIKPAEQNSTIYIDALRNSLNKANNEMSKDNWTFKGVAEGIKKTFDDAIDVVKRINFDNAFGAIKGVFGVPGYANGGFTSADVFFANENGVPELVGTVGGKTAVASGTEITGISDAVYNTGNTQASLLTTAVSLLQQIADNGNGFNEDAVFNSVRRSAQSYTNRTGNPAFTY